MSNQPTSPGVADLSDRRPHAVSKALHYDMLVFCHLRWNFVYQRPQHIISRMARTKRVLFIEEPILFTPGNENTANLIEVYGNLHVLQPRVKSMPEMAALLSEYIADTHVPIGWFYSASFAPLLHEFSFDKIVYDCMDNLSLLSPGAPLSAQEQFLLAEADVVFTGRKSLNEAKHKASPHIHCMPSAVDRRHFEKGLNNTDAIPEDSPVIGYYGVIDEAIDLGLIAEAAARMPDAHFVLVGPVKLSEKQLPQAENIHYSGLVPYAMLPNYLKSFDIAMLPFAAADDATHAIGRSKTLEYMAAQKPIISTPIDAVKEYGDCVHIVSNTDEFCDAIGRITHAGLSEREQAKSKYDSILNDTSWETTVTRMNDIINAVAA